MEANENIKRQLAKPQSWLVKYFPARIKNVSEAQKADRQLVYDFKDGRSHERVAQMAAARLQEQYGSQLADIVLVCVPASSPEKDAMRYRDFSARVSELSGIQNGYGHVRVESDRLALHEQNRKKRVRTAQVISFDEDYFKGKTLLVFDDVVTTATSFALFADKLEQCGANVIGGLFLGRTSYRTDKQ